VPRYKLTLEYDGGPFVGWQAQANGPSVQAALQAAVHAFSAETVAVTGAGRTDTGVHASGQVAHIELSRDWPERTVREAVNAHLWPQPIAVLEAERAADDFHARFSATGRRYLFRILDRRAPPALLRGRVWHVRKLLDPAAMAEAARALVGRHDFTTFRDAACQAESPVRTLDTAQVERVGEEIHLRYAARSFCTARSARSPAPWPKSAPAAGPPPTCTTPSTPATAPPAAPSPRPRGSTSPPSPTDPAILPLRGRWPPSGRRGLHLNAFP
jgi:tRNA pseudouridine38-40 synthase